MKSLKWGIPTGHFITAKCNCTEKKYELESRHLYDRFIQRGYPKKNLIKSFNKVIEQSRDSLLGKKLRMKILEHR